MSTDTRVRGQDGKFYPGHVLTPQERARARVLAHRLHCQDRMSIRAVKQVMMQSHGLRRSVGSIQAALRDYECPACAEPEHPNT